MDRACPDGKHRIAAVKIALHSAHIIHRSDAQRVINFQCDVKARQTFQNAVRRRERRLVRDHEQTAREMTARQHLADTMHRAALYHNIVDGTLVRLPARAVLVLCDELVKIQH